MNVKEIKTLVGIMEDSSLTALEIEVPDLKLRLERSAGTGSVAEVLQPPVYSVPAAAPAPAPEAVPAAPPLGRSPEPPEEPVTAAMFQSIQSAAMERKQELHTIDDVTALVAEQLEKVMPLDEETNEQFQQLMKKMIEQAGK